MVGMNRTYLTSNFQHIVHFDSMSLISATTESCHTLILFSTEIHSQNNSPVLLLVASLSVEGLKKRKQRSQSNAALPVGVLH